jgi:RNA recognition motif-containing protein
MAKKLFIGGLSWDTTDAKLSEFFSKVGTVVSANVVTDRYSGKSRGFGFVEMATEAEAEAAKKLSGQNLDGRTIAVNEAKPIQPRSSRFESRRGGKDNRRRY